MTTFPPDDLIRPGRNCWRIEEATRAAVIIDADDYFLFVRDAMMKARRRIIMIGWDFDSELVLDRDEGASEGASPGPESIGLFIHWLVGRNPDLEVFLLRWDVGALRTLVKPRTLYTFVRWVAHPRIHIKLDHHHPAGGSHHQKVVVLDDETAFCGGIDMTLDRWDTRRHADGDPGRRRPDGSSYGPWHDATTCLDGPVARALGELCRQRWTAAGGRALEPVTGAGSCWPEDRRPDFERVPIAISRTVPVMDDQAEVAEIEQLYVDLIGSAKRRIYAESQYFASRRVAVAFAGLLDENPDVEIVIVNPRSSEGWLEPIAMDTARARLMQALAQRDPRNRLRMYHPKTEGCVPIYVHAKILIVDDRFLRIGSSNLNNRSMRLDSECDVTIDAATAGEGAGQTIAGLRSSLVAEHLGVEPSEIERRSSETGSLVATIEALRQRDGRTLEPYQTPNLPEVEAWLADNEVLDPEGPQEMFAPLARRGLFRKNSLHFRIRHRGH